MKKKNLLFLSLIDINKSNIYENSIYQSLLRKFTDDFNVYILSPIERRNFKINSTNNNNIYNIKFIKVKIGNITKTNIIEKGISTIDIERRYIKSIKKHLSDIKFDLILYPTPPITFYKVIKYLKKRDGAMTYLMLKDIFPQNAVDLGFFSKRSPIYKYFRKKEQNLYKISDYIGCMSKANVDYLLKHNPDLEPEKVEILPNSIDPIDISVSEKEKKIIREKYNLPLDKKIFIYGGNLGKPQGIPFLLKCIENVKDIEDTLFIIIGNGTEYNEIIKIKNDHDLDNLIIMNRLDKDEFDKVAASSDIGILSLDYRFTIPNYPSRLLTYMQVNLPVLAITDPNTDVGSDIVEGGFGWWVNQHTVNEVRDIIIKIIEEYDTKSIEKKKLNSYNYLKDNFDIYDSYRKIASKL